MPAYEYKVVPAPTKGVKAPGVKTAEARFSHTIETLMNTLSAEGWEYQRAETLPSLERAGLTGTTTEWRNVLVFRRPRADAAESFAPELLPPPETTPEPKFETPEPPVTKPVAASSPSPTNALTRTASKRPEPLLKSSQNAREAFDERPRDIDDGDDITSTLEKFATARSKEKSRG
ncbi:MAG: DUF4177 domain-containing protein [Pseudomonadota bacterium]